MISRCPIALQERVVDRPTLGRLEDFGRRVVEGEWTGCDDAPRVATFVFCVAVSLVPSQNATSCSTEEFVHGLIRFGPGTMFFSRALIRWHSAGMSGEP